MEILLRKLRERGIRLEAVGLQSHMHQRKWSLMKPGRFVKDTLNMAGPSISLK